MTFGCPIEYAIALHITSYKVTLHKFTKGSELSDCFMLKCLYYFTNEYKVFANLNIHTIKIWLKWDLINGISYNRHILISQYSQSGVCSYSQKKGPLLYVIQKNCISKLRNVAIGTSLSKSWYVLQDTKYHGMGSWTETPNVLLFQVNFKSEKNNQIL